MKQHLRGFSLSEIGLPLLAIVLFFLSGCNPTEPQPPTPIVVTATPEPTAAADLEATIAALATEIAGGKDPVDPPAPEPPAPEPPAPEPPDPDPPIVTPTTEPPAPPPPDPPTTTPTIAIPHGIVSAPVSVNVRSGPDTEYPIARVSARGTRLEVVGRSLDGEWWQVRVPDIAGGVGWVSTIYLETQNTANVPVAPAPPLPPTITPSPTATRPPAPPPNPPSSATLDWRASPYYGSHDIYATFDSRTVSYSVTGGGEINAQNAGLPNGCRGYVSSAPDLEIDLQDRTDLYIYFLSGSDATLIINDPYGNWYCDDDSYGDGNPMVVFRGANTGVYDIWVGRYGSSGLTQPGTLYIGEMHP